MRDCADLHAEFELAYRNWTPEHDRHLAKAGISVEAVVRAGDYGVQRIDTTGRLYQPSLRGFPAYILGVRALGLNREILDLIAVRVDSPERWWYRVGEPGLILGEDRYFAAVSKSEAVRGFDSPTAWLRSNCDGCVVLDDVEARWTMKHLAEDDTALRAWWGIAA